MLFGLLCLFNFKENIILRLASFARGRTVLQIAKERGNQAIIGFLCDGRICFCVLFPCGLVTVGYFFLGGMICFKDVFFSLFLLVG